MVKYLELIFVIIVVQIIGILVFHSCSVDNEECSKTGEIIDYDGSECLCCPGWIVKTGQDTIKVLNLPGETQIRNIVETSGFPIKVKLNYENILGTCEGQYKKVTCFVVIN